MNEFNGQWTITGEHGFRKTCTDLSKNEELNKYFNVVECFEENPKTTPHPNHIIYCKNES